MRSSGKLLIGLDLGTSAVKGVLLSQEGSIVSTAETPREYDCFGHGCVEFDAEALYSAVADTVRSLTALLPQYGPVAALAMASASGNTLITDSKGVPLAPAISWLDERVTDEMECVLGTLDALEVHRIVGWPLLKSFPLAHLSWLRRHRGELYEKASTICMSTEYIIHRMTGQWATDSSTATPFYLQDQAEGRWHKPFLDKLEIPETKLPEILPSGTAVGPLLPHVAERMGLPAGPLVVLGSFDHPCAARGAGVLCPKQMLLSCGTSWVGFYPVYDRNATLQANLLVDPFLAPLGPWGAMFSLPAIGKRLEAVIDEVIGCGTNKFSIFSSLASSVEHGAGGLLLNPLSEFDYGLLQSCSRPQVCRALLEGMAFLVRSRMDELAKMGICASSIAMAGGPSETGLWPQVIADVLGVQVSVINGRCAGATGAALLAGVGAGLYRDEADALERCQFRGKVYKPADSEIRAIYDFLYQRFIDLRQ